MLLVLLVLTLFPGDDAASQSSNLDTGRQAYAHRQYTEAASAFKTAAETARSANDDALLVEATRLLATVLRETGDAAGAGQLLEQTAAEFTKAGKNRTAPLAIVWEEIAAGNRAMGKSQAAFNAIEEAIAIRQAGTEQRRPELARDLGIAAMLRKQAGQTDEAIELLKRSIAEWDVGFPGDPQCLPALEALAAIYRDGTKYEDAEPLLLRALRLREAVSGPDDAETISVIDSLAYVEFGLRKMPEAEKAFQRLLDLWEKNAGPDHPMVALTYDKMAEFYAFGQRYEEAQKAALHALAMRTATHIASLHQTGRIYLMQAKLDQAADLYKKTIEIGELAGAPDEVLDPPLRVYAKILREQKHDAEAQAVEQRVTKSAIERGDKEGRKEPPGRPSAK
jgi:tetratricopeptide (TPR) repeat protein